MIVFPGYYGANQTPDELATIRKVPIAELIEMYPEFKSYY